MLLPLLNNSWITGLTSQNVQLTLVNTLAKMMKYMNSRDKIDSAVACSFTMARRSSASDEPVVTYPLVSTATSLQAAGGEQ